MGKHASKRTAEGFTLIEIGVVVVLLAVVMAIAIPSLYDAKRAANEANAVGSLKTITTMCEIFRIKFDTYPANLTALANAGLLEGSLPTGVKSGYAFGSSGGGGNGNLTAAIDFWSCYAEPTIQGETGDRHFRVDQSGLLEESRDAGGTWMAVE